MEKKTINFEVKSKKDLKAVSELKAYYQTIYKCKSCGLIYGSDSDKDNGICRKCMKKLRNSKMEMKK